MQKFIELKKQKIEYTLRVNKKARSLRLSVYPGGECRVTVPRFVPQFIVNSFIRSKADWIIEKIDYFSKNPQKFKSKKEKQAEYLKYKNEALNLVLNRLEYFNQIYNLKWNNVVIKNQKTRWGSCSSRSNLNFNYKIAQLPAKSADYIIIHELCHLAELNHSKKFWALVAKAMPDYKIVQESLKTSGLIMN